MRHIINIWHCPLGGTEAVGLKGIAAQFAKNGLAGIDGNAASQQISTGKIDFKEAFLTGAISGVLTVAAGKIPKIGVSENENETIKSGINQLKPYTGIKQASQFLREQGFTRSQRVEYLQSFDVRTVYMDVADDRTYGIRFHDYGKNAFPKGRFLYETFSPLSTREGAAIKQSWNWMTGIKQWKIKEGTIIIKGKAAPQNENGYQFAGGVEQWFISKMKYLEEP